MSVLLFTLPIDVLQGSVLPLLRLGCISRLDCAVANRSFRADLFQIYSQIYIDEYTIDFPLCVSSAIWAQKRRLKFKKVHIMKSVTEDNLSSMLFAATFATQFDFSSNFMGGQCVAQWLKHCPSLRQLTLNCHIKDTELSTILRKHKSLQALRTEFCTGLTDKSLKAIAQYCSKLHELDISYKNRFTGDAIVYMLSRLPMLQVLNIVELELLEEDLRRIADCCPLLRSINISDADDISYVDAVVYVSQKCPLLTCMGLKGDIDDTHISAVAEALPRLQEIRLTNNHMMTSVGVQAIATHCKELRVFALLDSDCKFDDQGLIALSDGCPLLTHVSAVYWYNTGTTYITDVSVLALAKRCPRLQEFQAVCKKLSNDAVVALVEHCPQLTDLNLSGMDQLTDDATAVLASHCRFLRTLDLSNCVLLTDKTLFSLAAHCPHIATLDVSECSQITSAGVSEVARRCPYLDFLNVSRCDCINDEAAIAVVQHCRRLRIFKLTKCSAVTDVFADAFMAGTSKLNNIIAYDSGMSNAKLQQLEEYIRNNGKA